MSEPSVRESYKHLVKPAKPHHSSALVWIVIAATSFTAAVGAYEIFRAPASAGNPIVVATEGPAPLMSPVSELAPGSVTDDIEKAVLNGQLVTFLEDGHACESIEIYESGPLYDWEGCRKVSAAAAVTFAPGAFDADDGYWHIQLKVDQGAGFSPNFVIARDDMPLRTHPVRPGAASPTDIGFLMAGTSPESFLTPLTSIDTNMVYSNYGAPFCEDYFDLSAYTALISAGRTPNPDKYECVQLARGVELIPVGSGADVQKVMLALNGHEEVSGWVAQNHLVSGYAYLQTLN